MHRIWGGVRDIIIFRPPTEILVEFRLPLKGGVNPYGTIHMTSHNNKVVFNIMLSKGLGGIQSAFVNYGRLLESLGYEVVNIVAKNAKVTEYLTEHKGMILEKVRNLNKYDPATKSLIKQLAGKYAPTIIFCHTNRSIAACKLVKKSYPTIKFVSLCYNFRVKELKKSDYFLAVNKPIYEHLVKDMGEKRVIHMPLVNDRNWSTEDSHKDIDRTKFVTEDYITVGFLGRLSHEKGCDILIEAVGILKKEGMKIRLVIAGSGDEAVTLKKKIVSSGIDENSKMIGWVDHLENFFSQIDMLCIPSRIETFGLVVLDGFRHKVPIIASKTDGPLEICEDGKNAILFEINDAVDLATKIRYLRNNWSEKAEVLTRNALVKLEEYSPKKIRNRLKEALEIIVSE